MPTDQSPPVTPAQLTFGTHLLEPRPSGALWWPEERLLCVADLHLGKAERVARRTGSLLPPYDTQETLARLEGEIRALHPRCVICLGDSFDDMTSASTLSETDRARLDHLVSVCEWIWISGNHDPNPVDLGGRAQEEFAHAGLRFRHIATDLRPDEAEISGHYHPKAQLCHLGRRITRPCFLSDRHRLILPAFGCYTGGLDAGDAVFDRLLSAEARAWLTGPRLTALPRRALL